MAGKRNSPCLTPLLRQSHIKRHFHVISVKTLYLCNILNTLKNLLYVQAFPLYKDRDKILDSNTKYRCIFSEDRTSRSVNFYLDRIFLHDFPNSDLFVHFLVQFPNEHNLLSMVI